MEPETFNVVYGLLSILLLIAVAVAAWVIVVETSPSERLMKQIKERGPSETITIHGDGTTTVKKHKCIIPVEDVYHCTACRLQWYDRKAAENHTCVVANA